MRRTVENAEGLLEKRGQRGDERFEPRKFRNDGEGVTGGPAGSHPAAFFVAIRRLFQSGAVDPRLEQECQRNMGGLSSIADFKTIAYFRKDKGPSHLQDLLWFVLLCRRLELFSEASVGLGAAAFATTLARVRPEAPVHDGKKMMLVCPRARERNVKKMLTCASFRKLSTTVPRTTLRRSHGVSESPNATTLGGAVFVLGFALYDAVAKLWTLAAINVLAAFFLASIPLWHRAGPLVAPLVYVAGSYTAIFVICSMLGTDSGMQIQYLAIAAGTVLVVGAERLFLLTGTSIVAVSLVIALEILVPADTGLLTQRQMLENFIGCTVGTSLILFAIVFYAVREAARAEEVAEREYQRSESLLVNILPEAVARRLKSSTQIIADRYDNASVLFADMAGFTARASQTSPIQLVQLLNNVFTAFDHLVDKHGLEKIKTTGDGYMVVSGVPVQRLDHARP